MGTLSNACSNGSGKPSAQSSTHTSSKMPCPGPRVAALGNDGSRNGFQEWRCARTQKETNPWWQVDLGSEHSISSVQLWKAMTYHEHPKHPDGKPPVNSSAATGSSAPSLWLLISKTPFNTHRSVSVADARAEPDVVVRQLVLSHDSRVGSVRFDGGENVAGRYVRLQHESDSPVGSVLQFAELEVFARSVGSADQPDQEQRDGFYGVESSLDGDVAEYIDSEWLTPSASHAEVRFWIGSFNTAAPAVQWLADVLPNKRDAVSIELRYDQRTEADSATSTADDGVEHSSGISWSSIPVDARSSKLLDKESTELLGALEAVKSRPLNLSNYLNTKSAQLSASGSHQASWLQQLDSLKRVDPERIEKLLQKVETVAFSRGSSIMGYGERKRAVFFLREGEVELRGPHTSLGTKVIGTVKEHSIFNELSLFGGWAPQAAEFRASSSQVMCEVLDFASLVEVLGAEAVASIREGLIQQGQPSSAASTKPEDSGAEEEHYTDSTHAQVFRTKVPLSVLVGGGASPAALSHRFEFGVFEYAKESKQRGAKIGSVRLLPSQFSENGEGYLTLPIVSSVNNDAIGQLTLTFLVIKPFVHAKNTVASVWRSYWRPRAPLNVGHRGMGRSFHQVAGYRHALTRENTLASLILAGRSGADFVEFDVQLTKDRVPVIYHDFMVEAGLEDKHAWVHGTRAEPYEIGIHEMTLRQLQHSQMVPMSNKKSKNLFQQLVRKHWIRLVGDKGARQQRSPSSTSSSSKLARALGDGDDEADEEHLVEFFPKLEDLLKHVPAEVGLNVEIKYPDNVWRTAMRHSPPFAINEYVDAILRCVLEHAGENRRIFFSCFDPNLCVLLRAKQAKYPVLFLTYGSILPHAFDARMTLQFAVNFANMEKLGGIVSNSEAFLTNPELVQIVKQAAFDKSKSTAFGTGPAGGTAKVLLTWGDKNTSHDCVQLQKQHAMDGVISDNIGDLVRQDRKLSKPQ